MARPSNFNLLEGSAPEVARLLIGCVLERVVDGHIVRVRIVETEAYDQTDAASHSYRGETARTRVMFGNPGHLYVYFTYGMHYCCNIVIGPPGIGAAVLIRAVEPLKGRTYMYALRRKKGVEISNGPAKTCQALGIDMKLNGHALDRPPLRLIIHPPVDPSMIVQTTRIGITRSIDVPWRFYLADNPYVSRP